jgi:hypothetical protein
MYWFEDCFGFFEHGFSFKEIQEKFKFDKQTFRLTSKETKETFEVGKFITPTLQDLKTIKFEDLLDIPYENIFSNNNKEKNENFYEEKVDVIKKKKKNFFVLL